MRKLCSRYIFAFFILFFSFELIAQTNEMELNKNQIDQDLVPASNFISKVIDHRIAKNDITLIVEKSNDSLFSIYFLNNSNDSLSISNQDLSLFLIQEAKNQNGIWKPIEYWKYSSCGNSYLSKKLEPNGILKTESKVYHGDFETQIRFKLLNDNKVYYSNSLNGFVDLSQFNIPSNVTKHNVHQRILKRGSQELLYKMIFLEPYGLNEFIEKEEAYLKKMAALREKNKN